WTRAISCTARISTSRGAYGWRAGRTTTCRRHISFVTKARARGRPGTDTRRFFDAGAMGTAVFDGEKFMLVKRQPVNETQLFDAFPEADLILIEGLKGSSYPKLFLKAGKWQDPQEVAAMLEKMLHER
ncbi:MAG: molybdopterin-guanine dinucleotide biosynthesis protein MobB, partial [Firmicutes bacterium]|nr:molybdopterin-guanine dinucleotide biosynthesis protein MobB [Bacillota bacterium]